MPAARVVAVIQARMGASRLPGKVLLDLSGRPVLSWVVRAATAADGVDQVVVATTDDQRDDPVAALAAELGVAVVRGSETDVLERFVHALDTHPADAVIRLTADCPLLDPALIAQVAAAWRADQELDYVATTLVRTLPRGLDVELVRAGALRDAHAVATGPHREHVTSLLYTQPEGRRLLGIVVHPPADDLRVTLDTPEDFTLLQQLAEQRGDRPPRWDEVVATLRARPDLVAINAHVEQKQVL